MVGWLVLVGGCECEVRGSNSYGCISLGFFLALQKFQFLQSHIYNSWHQKVVFKHWSGGRLTSVQCMLGWSERMSWASAWAQYKSFGKKKMKWGWHGIDISMCLLKYHENVSVLSIYWRKMAILMEISWLRYFPNMYHVEGYWYISTFSSLNASNVGMYAQITN